MNASRPILHATLLALFALACKSSSSTPPATPPQQAGHADLSNDATATATVVSVDRATRLVTLRRDDGTQLTVEAGPAVRNLDQINAGDKLRVNYHESLTATRRPESEGTSPAKGVVIASRAKVGAPPAGGLGMAASVRVRIESVDREKCIVVFAIDSGELRTVQASRPEGRAFVQTLKVGDIVQLDYTSSVALSIEKL
jgi:hypothetical protein